VVYLALERGYTGAHRMSTERTPWLDPRKARRILGLAGPVILAMLTQTGVNVVDTYFIGKLPPEVASDGQFALTPSLMFLWAVGGFLSAISVGTQATTARRYGEEAYEEAGAVLPNAVALALAGGAIGALIGWFALPHAFSLLSDNPNVVALGTAYSRWRFLGIASMAATAACKAFYDGVGHTHLHLVAAVVMNIINLALCWVFIFGHLGAPAMGVEGAGLSACISTWVGFAVMLAFTLRKRDLTRYRFYGGGAKPVLSATMMTQLLRLSVPGGIATAVVMFGFLLFTKVVGRIDADAMLHGASHSYNGAATTIIIEVLSATFVSCMAFGTSTATLVGQSMGQGDPDLAEKYAWTSVKLGVLIFGAVGLVMFSFPRGVLAVFSHEPAVIEAGAIPMRIMATMGPVVATAMILTQALFGAGETRYVMVVEVTLHFLCLVPLAWLFGMVLGLGLPGVWTAVAVYAVALAALMALKFLRGGWKKLKV
jgi:multidrug resistance protein, MATE family